MQYHCNDRIVSQTLRVSLNIIKCMVVELLCALPFSDNRHLKKTVTLELPILTLRNSGPNGPSAQAMGAILRGFDHL
jgi:hypothetical protein